MYQYMHDVLQHTLLLNFLKTMRSLQHQAPSALSSRYDCFPTTFFAYLAKHAGRKTHGHDDSAKLLGTNGGFKARADSMAQASGFVWLYDSREREVHNFHDEINLFDLCTCKPAARLLLCAPVTLHGVKCGLVWIWRHPPALRVYPPSIASCPKDNDVAGYWAVFASSARHGAQESLHTAPRHGTFLAVRGGFRRRKGDFGGPLFASMYQERAGHGARRTSMGIHTPP